MIYFLLRRKIRLAKCKHLFIINVAASDVMTSLIGFFRGLGIIGSRFVGAPNNIATLSCKVYIICLNAFTVSGMLAMLPLTIDRLIAVVLPLKHKFIVTRKFSLFLIALSWVPIIVSLLYSLVALCLGTIDIEYNEKYYRCVGFGWYGKIINIQEVCLVMVPFIIVIAMYATMFIFMTMSRLRFNRFLITATTIIMTNLLTYFPTIIANVWTIPMSYEVSQVLITLYYVNGVINPAIHVLAHPETEKVLRSWSTNMRSSNQTFTRNNT